MHKRFWWKRESKFSLKLWLLSTVVVVRTILEGRWFSGSVEVPSQDHLREVHDVIAGASIDHFVSEDESSKIRNFAFRSFWRKDQLISRVVGFPKLRFIVVASNFR